MSLKINEMNALNEQEIIQSKDTNCSETVNWLVVAERQDASMYNPSCDENGRPILEPNKN
jgi:hypothetical protein